MAGTVLLINASGSSAGSATRAATDQLVAELAPETLITRDLAADPLPQIDEAWIKARLVPVKDRSDADHATLSLSDALIAELKAADMVVIGMPVYNFGMPAALKAYIDLIARPKVTFAYTEGGPVGLLEGKRAIVAVASGGTQIDSASDFATPHLRQVLSFIGIKDVSVYAAKDVIAAQAA
ncbi:FMN-dependent NADH-azoreductase [Yoonia litorea]|uniref:FMN dependent NADH:quinone oxidoreductase n=1 Tax=Yoonia litorea TaxID=1123755 RepID=A0A1I6L974_9RHOB|nr:NAD(P)H-dependent oxidoreductase [Yoonia litorea]SFS00016.1 FMN-dependent NADH-azoreductase [Yoonia litorea]